MRRKSIRFRALHGAWASSNIWRCRLRQARRHEVTGRLRVRKDGEAWLESTDAPTAGGAQSPRLQLTPKSMDAIVAGLPKRTDTEFGFDGYAWFKGKPAYIKGGPALVNITQGAILHDGQEYEIELLHD
jgi:hypothetical protein